ncbi:hypothetical protein ES705_20126 [subsurface metagenome]
MNSTDVIVRLEDMSKDPKIALDVDGVYALLFAVAVINSLPPSLIDCIDVILDLDHARQKQ